MAITKNTGAKSADGLVKADTKVTLAKTAATKENVAPAKTAPAKTTAAAKTAPAKKAAAAKAAPAKTTAPAKAATAKTTATKENVAPAKAAPAKKPAAAKTTPAKKTTAKSTAVKVDFFVEFNGKKESYADIVENVKNTYKANGGKADIKTLEVFLKPEENAAYFVVNGELEGTQKMDVFFC